MWIYSTYWICICSIWEKDGCFRCDPACASWDRNRIDIAERLGHCPCNYAIPPYLLTIHQNYRMPDWSENAGASSSCRKTDDAPEFIHSISRGKSLRSRLGINIRYAKQKGHWDANWHFRECRWCHFTNSHTVHLRVFEPSAHTIFLSILFSWLHTGNGDIVS